MPNEPRHTANKMVVNQHYVIIDVKFLQHVGEDAQPCQSERRNQRQ